MRNRKKKGKKNIIITIIFILIFFFFLNFFPPVNLLSYIAFYLLLYLTLEKSIYLFQSHEKSIFYALVVITYLLLRQLRIDNLVNLFLFFSVFVTLEIYFRKK